MNQNSIIDIARLLRVPAGFSLISNVLCAVLVFGGQWNIDLLLLTLASLTFYFAGMVGNDLADLNEDRELRPERVLPSGKIEIQVARLIMLGLLLCGFLAITSFAYLKNSPWTIALAVALIASIFFYNHWAKRFWFGAFAMGACRVINVFMVTAHLLPQLPQGSSWIESPFLYPIGLGIYIVGVTWFADDEDKQSQRWKLVISGLTIVAGLVLLCLVSLFEKDLRDTGIPFKAVIFCLLLFPVVRTMLIAIIYKSPQTVQRTIGLALRSIIVVDAYLCFAIHPDQPWMAICIVLLLLPNFLLGRWIRST